MRLSRSPSCARRLCLAQVSEEAFQDVANQIMELYDSKANGGESPPLRTLIRRRCVLADRLFSFQNHAPLRLRRAARRAGSGQRQQRRTGASPPVLPAAP
eukprot:801658-Pleurochrysis_carterae.AAC.1